MKNRILALLVPLLLLGQTAFAGEYFTKAVPLQFIRFSLNSDNPNPGQGSYLIGISNGNHNSANFGVAVAPQDTSAAIDVRDHFLKARPGYVPAQVVGTQQLVDSQSVYGCLTLRSTRTSTGDSIVVFRDWSADGITWAVVDSVTGHVTVQDSLRHQGSVPQDSLTFQPIANVITSPAGTGARVVSYQWPANPTFTPSGVTALAVQGINFIRFRLHLTAGDFAAAGTDNGVSGVFTYLAQDPNYNK